jgi:hypothetical protein
MVCAQRPVGTAPFSDSPAGELLLLLLRSSRSSCMLRQLADLSRTQAQCLNSILHIHDVRSRTPPSQPAAAWSCCSC